MYIYIYIHMCRSARQRLRGPRRALGEAARPTKQ